MNGNFSRTVIWAAALATAASVAQAANVSSTGCATVGDCTLAELFAGATLRVDDVEFTNFALDTAETGAFGGAPPFDPAAAVLSGMGGTGTAGFDLRFDPALLLDSNGEELEVLFTFDAAISGSTREMNGLSLAFGSLARSGDASVDANAEQLPLDGTGLAQIIADLFAGVTVSDSATIAPTTATSFSLDFGLTVFEPNASVTLSGLSFRVALQGDAPPPPPAAIPVPAAAPLMIGALSVLGFAARRRRIAS